MSPVSNTIRNPLAPPIGTTTLPPDMGTGEVGGAPNGAKMDKAVLASARGVLGELLSKLEPPLMRGKDDSVAVAALKDFARRSYSLGDTPMFSDKAIAVYRDAGLTNIARTLELYKNVREAANAVIDASWDGEAKAKLLTLPLPMAAEAFVEEFRRLAGAARAARERLSAVHIEDPLSLNFIAV